ncbi:HIT domain protein [uncultured archaeon]|nr:HIT domain protein [uncultured archaeon]
MKAIKKLAPAVIKVADAEGLNIIQNNGKAAGQAEPHVHFHLIPRKHGDGIWFETNRRKPKPMEMLETAKAINAEL